MNADDGFDESKVVEELEDYADTSESLHDPKKRHEILNRKNYDVTNTFPGDGPDLLAGFSREKGEEKVTITPV
jgi:hypothetical protein